MIDDSGSELPFSPAWQVRWVRIIAGVGILGGLLLSLPLWIGPRFLPQAPLLPQVAAILEVVGTPLYFLLLCLLALSAVVRRFVPFVVAALAVLVFFLLADQMRWRAAVYVYSMMLLGSAIASSQSGRDRERVLDALRLALVSVYFWAGVHKLNYTFITAVFPWMVRPVFPHSLEGLLPIVALAIPFLEASFGVGLLLPRFRKIAVVAICIMHLFILSMLGPFGHQWNAFVWPWNVAMASLVVVLFWKETTIGVREILIPQGGRFHRVILLLFTVMPAANMFHHWDTYPSFSLYTGDNAFAELLLDSEALRSLPEYAQPIAERDGDLWKVDVQKLGTRELGAPPYPEERVFLALFDGICDRIHAGEATLRLHSRPGRFSGRRTLMRRTCR